MPKNISDMHKGFHPFGELIGLEFAAIGDGRSRCELEVKEGLFNPHGVLHGGAIYAMADTGMGGALYTVLDENELCTTVEIKIAYFKAVKSGKLVCETRVIERHSRIAILESEVTAGDKLVAKALGTFYIYET
ncbi:MAG: PaaI family thioesterase [Actinobacteria bacterium]|nr:PaaI family thioesterase [Actinomycetota bacterium]